MDAGWRDAQGAPLAARLVAIRRDVDACRSRLRTIIGRELNKLLAATGPSLGDTTTSSAVVLRAHVHDLATDASDALDGVAESLEQVLVMLDQAESAASSMRASSPSLEPPLNAPAPASVAVAASAPPAAAGASGLKELGARLDDGSKILEGDGGLDADEALEPVNRCRRAVKDSQQRAANSRDPLIRRSVEQDVYLSVFNEISSLRFDEEDAPLRWRQQTVEFLLGVLADAPFDAVPYDHWHASAPIVPGRTYFEDLPRGCFIVPSYEQAALSEGTILRVVRQCFLRPGRSAQDAPEVVQQGKLVVSDGSLHV